MKIDLGEVVPWYLHESSLVSHYYTKLMPSRPRLIPSEDQVLLSEAGTPSWCCGDISRRQPASHLNSLETTQLLEVATFFCKRYVEKHIWTQWFVSCSILVESWQLHHPRWIKALKLGCHPGWCQDFDVINDLRKALSEVGENGEKGENGTPSSQYLTQNFMIYIWNLSFCLLVLGCCSKNPQTIGQMFLWVLLLQWFVI